jgi:hypothetical protein
MGGCGVQSAFMNCAPFLTQNYGEIYRKIMSAIATSDASMMCDLEEKLMCMKNQYDAHNTHNLENSTLFDSLSEEFALTNDPEIACQMQCVSECILGEYNTTDDYTKMVQSILDL